MDAGRGPADFFSVGKVFAGLNLCKANEKFSTDSKEGCYWVAYREGGKGNIFLRKRGGGKPSSLGKIPYVLYRGVQTSSSGPGFKKKGKGFHGRLSPEGSKGGVLDMEPEGHDSTEGGGGSCPNMLLSNLKATPAGSVSGQKRNSGGVPPEEKEKVSALATGASGKGKYRFLKWDGVPPSMGKYLRTRKEFHPESEKKRGEPAHRSWDTTLWRASQLEIYRRNSKGGTRVRGKRRVKKGVPEEGTLCSFW